MLDPCRAALLDVFLVGPPLKFKSLRETVELAESGASKFDETDEKVAEGGGSAGEGGTEASGLKLKGRPDVSRGRSESNVGY